MPGTSPHCTKLGRVTWLLRKSRISLPTPLQPILLDRTGTTYDRMSLVLHAPGFFLHLCLFYLFSISTESPVADPGGGGVPGVPWNPLNFAKCTDEKYRKMSCVHKTSSLRPITVQSPSQGVQCTACGRSILYVVCTGVHVCDLQTDTVV